MNPAPVVVLASLGATAGIVALVDPETAILVALSAPTLAVAVALGTMAEQATPPPGRRL